MAACPAAVSAIASHSEHETESHAIDRAILSTYGPVWHVSAPVSPLPKVNRLNQSPSIAYMDLRYPIGQYSPPSTILRSERDAWIAELETLPDNLRNAVNVLSGDQLGLSGLDGFLMKAKEDQLSRRAREIRREVQKKLKAG